MEDEGRPLQRRIPGAARAAPGPSARPVLSDSVLERMQAAIDAAKEQSTAEPGQGPEPIPGIVRPEQASREVTVSAVNGVAGKREGTSKRTPRRDRSAGRPGSGKSSRDALSKRLPHGREIGTAEPASEPHAQAAMSPSQASALAKPEPPRLPRRNRTDQPAPQIPAAAAAETATAPAKPEPPRLPRRNPTDQPAPQIPAAAAAEAATAPINTSPAGPSTRESTELPRWTAPTPPAAFAPREPWPALPRLTPPPAAPTHSEPGELPRRAAPTPAAARLDTTALPERASRAKPAEHRPTESRPSEDREAAHRAATSPVRPAPRSQPERDSTSPEAGLRPDSAGLERGVPFRSASGAVKPEDFASRGGARQPQQRRARHQPSRRPRIKTVYLVAAATVMLTAAVAVALSQHFGAGNNPPPQDSPQQRAAARYDAAAVSWVVSQVSRSATVSCDQKTCGALVAAGFSPDQVQVLGASSGTPVTSQVIVETPDIRQIFGTRLATQYAPTVLTVEGSGPEDVVIAAVAPNGPAAYQKALETDMQARKAASATLLDRGSHITTDRMARSQLAAGLVDLRLMIAITAVGTPLPVSVIDFGNIAQNASPDVPLRYADIADPASASHLSAAAYKQAVIKLLNSLPASERPTTEIYAKLPGGVVALRIVFSAPSPFNALGPGT
jgi:hypothetical protein